MVIATKMFEKSKYHEHYQQYKKETKHKHSNIQLLPLICEFLFVEAIIGKSFLFGLLSHYSLGGSPKASGIPAMIVRSVLIALLISYFPINCMIYGPMMMAPAPMMMASPYMMYHPMMYPYGYGYNPVGAAIGGAALGGLLGGLAAGG
ncbi:hypothetical protein TELCIR_14579 [Teladorsagia circumcincta]|uniref:Uncharacterized protein n=1 Tax=Teladorsagia circumcincta TaxID=45464 RepID=A0A2G9U0M4_TELCI|nr:hypothetical protein TELCIR_14579 [Teladorsagia circumcincta]